MVDNRVAELLTEAGVSRRVFSLRLSPDLYEVLRVTAKEYGVSMNDVATVCLSEGLQGGGRLHRCVLSRLDEVPDDLDTSDEMIEAGASALVSCDEILANLSPRVASGCATLVYEAMVCARRRG